jgi:hypothetical protein
MFAQVSTVPQGAVDVYRKGHSTKCVYTSTIAKALYEVADAIGATVTVEKVKRCSDCGSYTADMISKVRSGYLLTKMIIIITPG